MINYTEISDYFISLSNYYGDLITNLKLQKLIYYAQAWNLAINEEPIFKEDFEAWVHGPVMPELYNEYKAFRWNPIIREDLIEEKCIEIHNSFPSNLQELLDDIVEEYFSLSAYELERMTHAEDPWKNARVGLSMDEPSNNIIKKEWMKKYYKNFIKIVE